MRNRKRDYPLSGVITCAKCDSPYNGVSNVKNHKTGEKRPYYRCSGRARHNIKCGNGDVRAEILETQVFEILDALFSAEEVSKERLRNLVADQYREKATDETSRELDKVQKELQNCQLKQEKLTDAYLEANITRELFERKSQQLRNQEGEIRIRIERMELQLLEKEQSKEYLKRAEEVVKLTRSVKENLHPVLRRELLKLMFKKLAVENQSISTLQFYEPFQSMYDSALKANKVKVDGKEVESCQKITESPTPKGKRNQSCLLSPSAVRWKQIGMTLVPRMLSMFGLE